MFIQMHKHKTSDLIRLFTVLLLLPLMSACGKQAVSSDSPVRIALADSKSIFSDSVTSFRIKVFYEPNAIPYSGSIGPAGANTWDIAQASYENLFKSHTGRVISVPRSVSEMTQISAQNRSVWTQDELVTLAKSLAPALSSGSEITVSAIFLSGKYNNDSSVLGIQFSGYPFAFVFKDVVIAVGGGSVAQKYVEQATLVHEIGHAVGLVNAGLPMYENHEDPAHPHHSTDADDVMYWQIGSRSDILSFVIGAMNSGRLNLFGRYSLEDGQNYHP